MLIYREDDWIAEVKIVKNLSDKIWDKYKLRVIRTIRESNIFKPIKDGTTFVVDCKKIYSGMGGWSLKEE